VRKHCVEIAGKGLVQRLPVIASDNARNRANPAAVASATVSPLRLYKAAKIAARRNPNRFESDLRHGARTLTANSCGAAYWQHEDKRRSYGKVGR
jgi:hypothetical protein